MTENKRYYGVDEEEYGSYWILDISNCKKTKEDFLDENKEIYDLYAWENYLNECAKTLKKNEVVGLLNDLHKENQSLKSKHMEMLDFIEEKGTVTVTDIKQWWNTTR